MHRKTVGPNNIDDIGYKPSEFLELTLHMRQPMQQPMPLYLNLLLSSVIKKMS